MNDAINFLIEETKDDICPENGDFAYSSFLFSSYNDKESSFSESVKSGSSH